MNVDQNRKLWSECPWHQHGGEWSQAWGGTDMLWRLTVLPRVLPIITKAGDGDWLEIGCGHGRMTHYLLEEMHMRQQLVGVDVVEGCVEFCRTRFDEGDHARFELTTGVNIPCEPETVAFAFSWDSLVHCDRDTVAAYLRELQRVMRPSAFAFLHHSNLGRTGLLIHTLNPLSTPHLRDPSVDWEFVARTAKDCGLTVLKQELIGWGGPDLIDCFTVLRKDTVAQDVHRQPAENPGFMEEAHAARRIVEVEVEYLKAIYGKED